MEHGLQARQLKRWKTSGPYCERGIANFGAITIYEASPILLMMIGGFILSLIVIWFEYMLVRTQQIVIDEKSEFMRA